MNRLPNVHPGEILRDEFLKPMGISQYRIFFPSSHFPLDLLQHSNYNTLNTCIA